jgi:spoIIIJ-associated protein
MPEPTAAIAEFLVRATSALGLSMTITVEPLPDGWRIDLQGEGGDVLIRRRGEALTALQHIVEAAYRKELGGKRVHLDCLNFRKDKDTELRQMAKYLAGKAKETGLDQQIGPLNPYERRLVHLEIAEDPTVTSESIGDAHMKTVIISPRQTS